LILDASLRVWERKHNWLSLNSIRHSRQRQVEAVKVAEIGNNREALKNVKEAIEGYLEVKTKLLGQKVKGEKAEVVVKAPKKSAWSRIVRLSFVGYLSYMVLR
jgi:hypothetical protein